MSEMPRTRSKKHLVLNEIEKLNASYPGLACYVKGWFDLKKPTDAIPALLQKQFGVTVSSSVLENYRCTVWAPEKELIALKSATAKRRSTPLAATWGLMPCSWPSFGSSWIG